MSTMTAADDTTRSMPWYRHAGWAGPAYALLLVLAAVAFPAPPAGAVVAAAHPGWLTAHSGAVIAQALVRALAALCFALLGVAAGTHIQRVAPARPLLATATVVGGALSGGLMLATQALAQASALASREQVSATGVRALGAAQEALLDASSLPAVLLFGAVGLCVLHVGGLPRWFGVVSVVGVPVALIDAASYDGGPLEGAAVLGLVWFLAWSLVAGVQLVRAAAR